jgi:hypothetical protein
MPAQFSGRQFEEIDGCRHAGLQRGDQFAPETEAGAMWRAGVHQASPRAG